MSRVFVSCAHHDRAVGERLGSLVRSLGHDSSDDRDEAQGTAWWNEVVGRIEASDVFVAVASPAYADAHACRLAAKHAAASGLPVVRVDLDDGAVPDCHPVVAQAVGVPFAPEDPEAVVRLAHALIGTTPDVPGDTTAAEDAPQPAAPEQDPGSDPPEPEPFFRQISGLEIKLAALMVLGAVGLLYVALSVSGGPDPSGDATPEVDASATTELFPSGTSQPGSEAAVALLEAVDVVGSPDLPTDSCQAGTLAVTCTNPAPNIRTVVLTPYKSLAALYEAYTAEVESLSGEPFDGNTGNCSTTESEGELGWTLDKGHTLDFTVAEQEGGGLDPASESAGRVFCTGSHEVMKLVWTQDPGLLATVTGQPSDMVVTWWSDVHLQLACASSDEGSGCAA